MVFRPGRSLGGISAKESLSTAGVIRGSYQSNSRPAKKYGVTLPLSRRSPNLRSKAK